MEAKWFKNLSLNTLQLGVNQLFGLLIFYVLSASLDKNSFGQVNLALAISLAVFNILSFGIDQLVVRKIASGHDAGKLLSLYVSHVLFTGLLFYGLLIMANLMAPQVFGTYKLLLFIGMGKLFIFLSAPFKQVFAGFERFRPLALMAVVSNLIRGIALVMLWFNHAASLQLIVLIFVVADFAELCVSILVFRFRIKIPLRLAIDKYAYGQLLRESFPQVGVVLFTSALARFDWIFIGITVSAPKLAEYSFAYKVFEIATLPLTAIAPLLVPGFTRIFASDNHRPAELKLLFRMEMIVSALIVLGINLLWQPVIDMVTAHQYGTVNNITIFILSLIMPLLYFTNFLWSIHFAKGHTKMIFRVIGLTFIVNIVGDIILIPIFHNEGAAGAYLIAMLVQATMYMQQGEQKKFGNLWLPLLGCMFCALFSGFLARFLFSALLLQVPVGLLLYVLLLWGTRQLRLNDLALLRSLTN